MPFFAFGLGGEAFGPRHDGDGGAIDIGIREAHPVAQARQCDGEVHCDGGLPDAALSGGYADDVSDLIDLVQVKVQGRILGLRGLLDDGLHFHLGTAGGLPVNGGPHGAHEIILQRIRTFSESERHRHLPIGHHDFLDHAEGDDVLVVPAGMLHLGDPVKYFFFCHLDSFVGLRPPQNDKGCHFERSREIYFAKSSSAMMFVAPPSFSTRKRT